ncbi:hypothetical protein D3874_26150 [Oleomonas cavernae]|uniref:Uncharacterized protein n=1 Tax=Oleomonas cavernae TaxID=2320859 RepID=A0A418VTY1_9PROT|nr:hypothetical protein [Oleomonas cavernae]RJF80599.1 hypothetical protein D3874_26150 [Oleomonas cavernae]
MATSRTHIRAGGAASSKGRLSIDRKTGTAVFSAKEKPADAAARLPTGRRPTQKVFLAEDKPSRTRQAMAKLLKDLGG